MTDREQVIASFAAEFEPMGYEMDRAKCHCCTFKNEETQNAFTGFAAGREQGLREAKEVCEGKALASALAHVNTDEQAFHIKAEAARSCAAAIEQLRASA